MEYTMKLIFKKSTDMNLMRNIFKNICDENGTIFLEQTDDSITYGADSFENFSPSLIDIRDEDYIKANLIGAFCTDPFDGTYSCRNEIFKDYK